MKRFQISEAEYKAIQGAEKETKDKNVSRRLRVLMMSYEGYSAAETAKMLGINRSNDYQQYRRYEAEGLKGFTESKYGGNHRALTEAQEREILEQFEKAAEAGQVNTSFSLIIPRLDLVILFLAYCAIYFKGFHRWQQ